MQLRQCATAMLCLALLAIGATQVSVAQNSTRKIRTKPSPAASKIGSSVRWVPSLDAAMEKAKATGKPVIWYVSTLPNTFMDRKTEIDRYLLGGPFSWPAIVNTINQSAIATRVIPTPDLQKRYQLNPYEFVEPGIVILSPEGKVTFSIDRLTTLQPVWLLDLLQQKLNVKRSPLYHDSLTKAWQAFAGGAFNEATKLAKQADAGGDAAVEVESKLLQGMVQFRNGDHDQALQTWKQAGEQFPDHPLGQKCAAEAQRIGPFSRGFETHRALPAAAMKAGIDSVGSAAPTDAYTENELRRRSVEFLLGMQHQNGGFFDSDYDFGGTDSLPNVYVAVTSLAGMALVAESKQQIPEGAQYDQAKLNNAIERALRFVVNDKHINKADRDEILWAYAFRLRLVARCKALKNFKPKEIDLEAELAKCIETLQSVQSRRGNWYHEYGNPFVTATALLSLHEAKMNGGAISEAVVQKGTSSLSNDRFGNGAYPYGNAKPSANGQKPAGGKRNIAASAGRMPLCELALVHFEKSDQKKLTYAVEQSLAFHDNLNSALKYDNHTSNLAYGGFFFWYDMRSRSEAILGIQNQETRRKFQQQHKALIQTLPELDGCFIDSHELGRVYGTAMALLSLANVNQD